MPAVPSDETWMREALTLASLGLGLTSPNPPVGAVVVLKNEVVGRGWHSFAGGPHAEVNALADARERIQAKDLSEASLYVTLEPCSTHGRTPPCVEAILAAGVRRVVVASTDPNPAHGGDGYTILRRSGVEVVTGICEAEGDHLIRFFSRRILDGRPWVIAKTAASLSGHTVLPTAEGPWISSPESREDVQGLRRQCEAILIGGETLRRDNPHLTLRGPQAEGRPQPLRVVFTSQKDLPKESRLFTDKLAQKTRIHCGISLEESLRRLHAEGVSAVLLESGGRLLAHAIEEKLVDELVLYVAPVFGGGPAQLQSPGALAGLKNLECTMIGPDVRIRGEFMQTRSFLRG
jgi:diaminohydroxyphosphoribosylaminopyrimidine deaminase / 5-amino-6-(5-phosphoribosylamino)uracil reductase